MKEIFKEFSEVKGEYVEEIAGQSRFAYSISNSDDLFEIEETVKIVGFYKGNEICFYDYKTSEIYRPFDLKKNIAYGRVIFIDNSFYILQVDFDEGLANIYKYYPGEILEKITDYKVKDLSTYNLELVGLDLHLISQDSETLEIYYPYRKTIKLEVSESALFIDDGKVYINRWIEEGWDDEKDEAGEDYKYYDKLIIKDFDSNIIEERLGSLHQSPDGTWWLA
ncbi:hypothetical protein HMPREF0072_0520 [Anaerococcus lactolyticus ATCC 51172]|uniref:Uncharacterized protein n=1 Tax=Anaerococcus lactolyticus ATCC 51172 TaxID=525254 RepID=C2BDV0_9FIRM|nr:hypothetical protein [Anaerococcus lactolyticus]EEI86965.1 hypothetical protein HMPREF0072_0520 [Anaerococcus lactolyticus ATCC 51172]